MSDKLTFRCVKCGHSPANLNTRLCGACQKQIDKDTAHEIFELTEKFMAERQGVHDRRNKQLDKYRDLPLDSDDDV